MIIRPKNWGSFQHYKDRNPPWIKLHRKLLDNFDFAHLPVESKAIAPLLWLIASESQDGCIQADTDVLAFRLRVASKVVERGITPLIEKGFFDVVQDASVTLAECGRLAVPETETEGEREAESLSTKEVSLKVVSTNGGRVA